MKRYISLVAIIIIFSPIVQSAEILPSQSGETLRKQLKSLYYDNKHSRLGYKQGRRAMYSDIDVNEEGKVCGVYSGYCQQMRDTTFLNPINAEHTVPQSWFRKKEPMKSDLHHLFPTHKDVNNARGSLPFAEIPDELTDKWFISNRNRLQIDQSKPQSQLDDYSEWLKNSSFEPPEHHKGNVARALAYFYTMYPTQAGNIGKAVKGNINLLRDWHEKDPVDSQERIRNRRIVESQGNSNPYIEDSTLLCRAWGIDGCLGARSVSIMTHDEQPASATCDLEGFTFTEYDTIQSQDRYPRTNNSETDYYYLVYSWSPAFCQSKRRSNGDYPTHLKFQCASNNKFGWVVHGLWAQSAGAQRVTDHPRFCKGDLEQESFSVIEPYMCMSPGARLLQGEWEKHGACDFETAKDYYHQTYTLHTQLKLPETAMSFSDLFDWMRENNPVLAGHKIKRLGRELVVCYNTDFSVMSCPD